MKVQYEKSVFFIILTMTVLNGFFIIHLRYAYKELCFLLP